MSGVLGGVLGGISKHILDGIRDEDARKRKYISVVDKLANEPFEHFDFKNNRLARYYETIFILRNQSEETIPNSIEIEFRFETKGEIGIKPIDNSLVNIKKGRYNTFIVRVDHLEPYRHMSDKGEIKLHIISDDRIDSIFVSGGREGWPAKYEGTSIPLGGNTAKRNLSELRAFIAIMGPIGAGKSNLAMRLKQKLNATILLEKEFSESNPHIEDFYKQMDEKNERYKKEIVFPTEVDFLLNRFDRMKDIRHSNGIVISDYSFYTSKVFANSNLEGDLLRIYNNAYYILEALAPKPDLIIYLKSDDSEENIGFLYDRIHKRAIPSEESIKKDYLKKLCREYESFFRNYDGIYRSFDAAEYEQNEYKCQEEVFNLIKHHFGCNIENS